MSFGLKVFRPNGAVAYSSTDVTWNQVDMLSCPANGSASGTYPALSNREVLTVQVMINTPPIDRRTLAHTVTVTGTTVTVSGGSEAAFIIILMR